MSDWTCPNCHGGFPEPKEGHHIRDRCPWCDQVITGEYESESMAWGVSKSDREDDDGFLSLFR